MRYHKWHTSDVFKIGTLIILGLYFLNASLIPEKWTFLDGVNLIFHEAGHVLFMFFGQFLAIAGGSITQILIPVVFFVYFFLNRMYFSAYVILFWVGHNFISVSVYAGDAIKQSLPLLGGESVTHDWNYLLSTLNMLDFAPVISGLFFWTGVILYFMAVFFGIYGIAKEKVFLTINERTKI